MSYRNSKCCDDSSTMVSGTSVDIQVPDCYSELRSDIVVNEFKTTRLWGRVVNCYGKPVANALLKLVKIIKTCDGIKYKGIAHTISDCQGFYQFDICKNPNDCYKVLVSKSDIGPECVLPPSGGNCDTCKRPYNPCAYNNNYYQDYTGGSYGDCGQTCGMDCPPPPNWGYDNCCSNNFNCKKQY